MALCCDFLARRLSLFTDIGQRARSRKAARTAARASQCLVAQPLERGRSLSSCPARQHGQHPETYRRHRLFTVRTLAPGKPMIEMIENQVYLCAGRIRPRDRPQRGSAGAVRGDALCAGRAAHPHPDRGGLRNARQARARALLERALADAEPDGFALPFAENFRYL